MRALLRPARRERRRLLRALDRLRRRGGDDDGAAGGGENGMMEEEEDPDADTEDVLTDLAEVLARYRPVVLATLARDVQVHEENLDLRGETKRDEGDMILMGEIHVLRQAQAETEYSDTVMEGAVEALVQVRAVGCPAVARWALGGSGGSHPAGLGGGGGGGGSSILPGWWKVTTAAVRVGVRLSLSDASADGDGGMGGMGDDIGMVIDVGGDDEAPGDGSPASRRIRKAIDCAVPLLRYCVRRSCELLSGVDTPDRKRPLPFQVDLIEGLKQFHLAVWLCLTVTLRNDSAVNAGTDNFAGGARVEIEGHMEKSDLAGRALSDYCRRECGVEGAEMVELLAQTLECM